MSVCKSHKIPCTIINKQKSLVRAKNNKGNFVFFRRYHNSINKNSSKIISNNKFKAGKLLGSKNLPSPKQTILLTMKRTNKKMPDYLSDFSFPVVLKQVNGTGGNNVYTNLDNWEHVLNALKKGKRKKLSRMILEEQISGDDHRVLVVDGEIIDIIKRSAAKVVGNGRSTIAQLIKSENKHRVHKIKPEIRYLHKHGLDFKSVPEKNKVVQVTGLCNYHKGGKLKRIKVENIHPENKEMLLKVAKCLDLRVAGIDFLTTDITKSYKETNGKITEVNADANLDLHYVAPPNGEDRIKYVEKAVLKMLGYNNS